jgi:cysteine synthase
VIAAFAQPAASERVAGCASSALLACQSIAILPEGMKRERFEWLSKVAGEVIATIDTESDVKEIFDRYWVFRRSGQDLVIVNQLDEFGNHLWHYNITGHALEEVLGQELRPGERLAGSVFTTASAGTNRPLQLLASSFRRPASK